MIFSNNEEVENWKSYVTV